MIQSNGIEKEYNGMRTASAILREIAGGGISVQKGGGKSIYRDMDERTAYLKYKKYKTKYLAALGHM